MKNYLRYLVVRLFKSLSFYTPLKRYVFYRYPYNFSPTQLIFLCSCIEKTKELKNTIVEIGCESGNTTVFLNKHMDFLKIDKPYICIDTFSGFTENDINYEVTNRGKEKGRLNGFKVNNKKWFDETIRSNEINRVKAFQADISQFDFKEIEVKGISFCLIDVDLYMPVKKALDKVYPLMVRGGIIVVDDCKPNQLFDGAYKAYIDFIETNQLPKKIILDKLGIIEI
jgi:hypothetical protein